MRTSATGRATSTAATATAAPTGAAAVSKPLRMAGAVLAGVFAVALML